MIRDTKDVVAHTVHCAKVHKANFVCTCGADLATAEKRIQSLSDRIDVLTQALERAAEGMTCRRDDMAHYCPNCDNSLDEWRDAARAALHQEGIAPK